MRTLVALFSVSVPSFWQHRILLSRSGTVRELLCRRSVANVALSSIAARLSRGLTNRSRGNFKPTSTSSLARGSLGSKLHSSISTTQTSALRRFSSSRMTAAMDIDMPEKVGDFRLVVEDQLDFAKDVKIAKWQSESTGLKVVYGSNESAYRDFSTCPKCRGRLTHCAPFHLAGPLVQGYFSVVTEIQDGKTNRARRGDFESRADRVLDPQTPVGRILSSISYARVRSANAERRSDDGSADLPRKRKVPVQGDPRHDRKASSPILPLVLAFVVVLGDGLRGMCFDHNAYLAPIRPLRYSRSFAAGTNAWTA